MAILKEKVLPNGAIGNYWRILNITFDRTTFTAHANLALFLDQATSDAGGPPIGGHKHFSFPYTNAEINAAPSVVGWIYDKILVAANVMRSVDLSGSPITPEAIDQDLFDGVKT